MGKGPGVRRLRLIILVSLAAILVGAGVAVMLHRPAEGPKWGAEAPPEETEDGKPRAKGLTYTHVEGGRRSWKLNAENARYDEGIKRLVLDKVDLEFYPEAGGTIRLTGDTGEYDQDNRVVTIIGNVRGRTHDGLILITTRLTYSEAEKKVTTDAPVLIAGPKFKVRGIGMIVKVPENAIIIETQADSTFIPQGTGPPPGVTMD